MHLTVQHIVAKCFSPKISVKRILLSSTTITNSHQVPIPGQAFPVFVLFRGGGVSRQYSPPKGLLLVFCGYRLKLGSYFPSLLNETRQITSTEKPTNQFTRIGRHCQQLGVTEEWFHRMRSYFLRGKSVMRNKATEHLRHQFIHLFDNMSEGDIKGSVF